MEAEQRAILVQGNNQFTRQSTEVHNSNPKTLYDARGNPYVEGEPNLRYSPRSLQPRYSQPLLNVVPNPNITHPLEPASVRANPDKGSTISPSRQPFIKINSQPFTQQTNIKPRVGQSQSKTKPKNWASLLQSQSPSMDMKLDYFPDLQRGKEALVEIDIELT